MLEESLHSIGLSKNEVRIYLALIELGPARMGQVCGKTKIHRRNVYDSIEMLKDKGFVSATIINNRNVFEAINPNRILEILEEKKVNIESILPALLARTNKTPSKIAIYTGLNGRKIIFEDKLKCKETQYVLGAHMPSQRSMPTIESYHRRRIQKKISLKMLFIPSAKEALEKFSKYKYVQARILPKKFCAPIAINLYGNKVAMLLSSNTLDQLTVLIEDKGLADSFKSYFELLWGMSRPLGHPYR